MLVPVGLRSRWVAACLAVTLLGCGAAPSAPIVHATPRPTGEPRAFLAPADMRLVLDHAALRMMPFAPEVGALYRASGLFQRFAGSALFDPLRDLDRVGASSRDVTWTSRGVAGERWRVVLRHHLSDAEALSRLERGALANGEELHWRNSQGLRSALLPGELSRGVPHVVLLSAPQEVVLVPEDELIDAVTTVRDHEARREYREAVIEPGLVLPSGVFLSGSSRTLPPSLSSAGAIEARGTGRWDGSQVELEVRVSFTDEASATAADAQLTALMGQFTGNNPFLVSLGLAGWITRLTTDAAGAELVVRTHGDGVEAAALCRAIAAAISA